MTITSMVKQKVKRVLKKGDTGHVRRGISKKQGSMVMLEVDKGKNERGAVMRGSMGWWCQNSRRNSKLRDLWDHHA